MRLTLHPLPAFVAALALSLTVSADAQVFDSDSWWFDRDDDFEDPSRGRLSSNDCVEVDFQLSRETGCKDVDRIMRNGLGVRTENGTLVRLVVNPSFASSESDEICVTPLDEVDLGPDASSRWADAVLIEAEGSGNGWLRNATLQVEFDDRREVEYAWGSDERDDRFRLGDELCPLPFSSDQGSGRIDIFGYHASETMVEIPIDGPGVYVIWSGHPDDVDFRGSRASDRDFDDDRYLDDRYDDEDRHDRSHSRGRGKKKGHEKHHDDDDCNDDDDDDDDDD